VYVCLTGLWHHTHIDNSEDDLESLILRTDELLQKASTIKERTEEKNVVRLVALQQETELKETLRAFIEREDERGAKESLHELRQKLKEFEGVIKRNHVNKRYTLTSCIHRFSTTLSYSYTC